MDWERHIAEITQLVRESDHPLHVRLRALLATRGVDVAESLLANLMPEDRGLTSGMIVTTGPHVFEFEMRHRGDHYEDAVFEVWRDLTDTYAGRPFRQAVSTALLLLERTPQQAEHAGQRREVGSGSR